MFVVSGAAGEFDELNRTVSVGVQFADVIAMERHLFLLTIWRARYLHARRRASREAGYRADS